MSCADNTKEMRFAVYEIWPDGGKSEDFKTITISPEKSKGLMEKYHLYATPNAIDDYAIVLTVFIELYGFTIGMNGFRLNWNDPYKDGFFHWAGPREPACRIGGNWWQIKRIT